MKNKIKATLKDYSESDIEKAIKRYSKVVHGAEYYFNYKWGLFEFLQRGISQFDNDVCFDNYLSKDNYKVAVREF